MRIDIEIDEFTDIAGGDFCDESGCVDAYYIALGDVNLEVSSATLKELCVSAINHLIINGHTFKFIFDNNCDTELISTD